MGSRSFALSAFTVLVALAAGVAPQAASAKRKAREDTSVVKVDAKRVLKGLTRERFGRAKDAALQRRADDVGEVILTGVHRLSGEVYATRLEIAESASVEIETTAAIYVSGDFVIDGDVTLVAPDAGSPSKRRGPPRADDGASVPPIVMDVGNLRLRSPLVMPNGGDGADFVGTRTGIGGNGGAGGSLAVRCRGTFEIAAPITVGRGGKGGSSTIDHTEAPLQGPATATGGNGGPGGWVAIQADTVNITYVGATAVTLRAGGDGGDATAIGSAGADAAACGDRAAPGAQALARGGDAGIAGALIMRAREVLVPPTPSDPVGFRIHEADLVEVSPEAPPLAATYRLNSSGGDAHATGGAAGRAADCGPGGEVLNDCPKRGPRPMPGGEGGAAVTLGGRGGDTPVLSMNAFWTGARFTTNRAYPGRGGDAESIGGAGGDGGSAAPARSPREGGTGGRAGSALARGGDIGRVRLEMGHASSEFGDFYRTGDPDDPVEGGVDPVLEAKLRGAGVAREGARGDGGNGGDCCGSDDGIGALGGAGGPVARKLDAVDGGLPLPNGRLLLTPGNIVPAAPGAAGLSGANCEGGGNVAGTGSESDPFRIRPANGNCQDQPAAGDPSLGFDFFLLGGDTALARPPSGTNLTLRTSAFQASPGVHFELKIDGVTIVDETTAGGKVESFEPRYVQFDASGKICFEVYRDGAISQSLRVTID